MIKLAEMLKCGLCHDRFDIADRKPLTLSLCGHTFCKKCLCYKSDDISVTSCPYKCFPFVDNKPVTTVPNFSLINLLDNIAELSFNFLKPAFENGLSIDCYCSIHEKATREYDYIEQRFICSNCQLSGLNLTTSLKTLLDDYQAVINYTKGLFRTNKAQLNSIEKLGAKAEDMRAQVRNSTMNQADEYINKAYYSKQISNEVYLRFGYMKDKYTQKIELHLNMLSELCDDYNITLRNIEENGRFCTLIDEREYDLSILPCTGICLKPFKPAAYFLNKVKGIEKYVENQISKYSRKFVMRFLKICKTVPENKVKLEIHTNSALNNDIITPRNDSVSVKDNNDMQNTKDDTDINLEAEKPRSKYGLRKKIRKF